MPKRPIELMFGAYRRQLLATLLLRPDERFHVRELERMTSLSAGTIHRELRTMAEAGLLLRDRVGNQVLYSADKSCPIYAELASIMRKTIGFADLLSEALQKNCSKIDLALVFGSMVSGNEKSGSDIDLLVIGNLELIEIVGAMEGIATTLRREINPIVMTRQLFAEKVESEERFANRVVAEQKIFIIGTESDFAKLVQDRATIDA